MNRFLYHDPKTSELRLVMTDFYAGNHERTEFRVLSDDNGPVRNRPDLDGVRVFEQRGMLRPYYVKAPNGAEQHFAVEHLAVGPTVTTACPRAAAAGTRRRPKCDLCTPAGTP
jgi:hypothetical protein